MACLLRSVLALLFLAAAFPGTAAAEKVLTVNDNTTGTFDQPSVVMNGSTAHVAFIGDNVTPGAFRVYYAAVNGAADFTNLALPRDSTVLITLPTPIDNTDIGNDLYADARHPKISLRSATEVVILFQAKENLGDVVYRPYIAQLTLVNNVVAGKSVKKVVGAPAGDIEDLSYGLVATDNTARIAFANRSAIGGPDPFQVVYARVGLDNATVVGPPLTLTAAGVSDGFRPLPSLRIDASNRSHIAWAATDSSSSNPGAVYYALVKQDAGGTDNLAIGATEILGLAKRWSHPNVLVANASTIIVLAADESVPGNSGNIGVAQFNPDAVTQNGAPVQVSTAATFFYIKPYVLPASFDLYRPEAFLDPSGRIHVAGYGNAGTTSTYYVIQLSLTYPFATFQLAPTPFPFGFGELPGGEGSDYTKAAFGYISGKAVLFWSGIVAGSAPQRRNLDVTTVPTLTEPIPFNESGCSMVKDPRAGERGRIPGAFLLFLPAVIIALRRIPSLIRRHRSAIAEK